MNSDPNNMRFRLLLTTLVTSVSTISVAEPVLSEALLRRQRELVAEKQQAARERAADETPATPSKPGGGQSSPGEETDEGSDQSVIGCCGIDAWDRAHGVKFRIELEADEAALSVPWCPAGAGCWCLAFPVPSLPRIGWLGDVSGPTMLPLPPPAEFLIS